MILIDSNIPMYLVGAAHPHKVAAQRALERLIEADERLVTDAEVLQEILHRYTTSQRRDAIQPAFDALLSVVAEVFPVDAVTAKKAKDFILASPSISARDALHLAVMEQHGIQRILSFDRDFDQIPGIIRLSA
ncbi:MAG TPA: type II toxin-antitoxin system VapC family toxin [Thermoanaerobaculia bacterium]|nr:type II toxin-antitoxin system VapC family toxin [Thermoanaerobaculia bacterium]